MYAEGSERLRSGGGLASNLLVLVSEVGSPERFVGLQGVWKASRGCCSTPGCGKADERAGSNCAIDVAGHKRRPPSKVGGPCHQFRVYGLGLRV